MKKHLHYTKLLQYFLQGLLIMAPVAITAYSIYFVVSSIDSWIPIFTYNDPQGIVHVRNYGFGFVLIIAVIIVLGYFSSFFLISCKCFKKITGCGINIFYAGRFLQ